MAADKKLSRARLTSQIREEQAEADALFLSIGDGAIVTDSQGRISRINNAALEILGFTRRDLIGKWYPEAVVAQTRDGQALPNLSRPITQVFLTGRTISTRIYFRRKDGSSVACAVNVAPVLRNGKPIGAIEVFRDITRELVLEQAKDDFISVASHQLRTPATAVKQFVAMLLEGYAGSLTLRQIDLLRRAYESNERQLHIIEDLLKVARVDAGNITLNLEEVDLIELIGEVIGEQSAKAVQRGQITSFSAPAKRIPINIDQARMRMVFENLLDNAIKYTPEGKKIAVSVKKTSSGAIVRIQDEGVGISQTDIKKLFQKFTRISNPLSIEAGGTGLGLYWAERIIKLHNGRIDIESAPNKGSVFSVRLPLRPDILTEEN